MVNNIDEFILNKFYQNPVLYEKSNPVNNNKSTMFINFVKNY